MPPALRLLRPHHWTKNLLAFAGVVFGGRLLEPGSWALAAWSFVLFCLASSAVYALNDVRDRERDALHPRKKLRPIPSGELSVAGAAWLGGGLAVVALGGGWVLQAGVFACLVLYFLTNLAYTLLLKHSPLLDVMAIALGFVFRLLAGIYVLGDLPTSWIVLCTFFLAIFLGFAKRRAELVDLTGRGEGSHSHEQRPVLEAYTVEYLDSLLGGSATMAVLCYALFTATADKNHLLLATVPIVYYAVMHYKRQAMTRDTGEEPERILVGDPRIYLSILLWVVLYVGIEFWDPVFFG